MSLVWATQSLWRLFRGNYTSLVVDGVRHQIMKGNEIYRSRLYLKIWVYWSPSGRAVQSKLPKKENKTKLYVFGSLWRLFRGNYTSLVVDGVRHQIMKGNEIYRSRWC
jgi:hypothetical protein